MHTFSFAADCQPGDMSDGQLCAKCPRGTFQPDRWMTACTDCPWNFTTRDVGSISIADCKRKQRRILIFPMTTSINEGELFYSISNDILFD